MRRGALYNLATELGCNKIALGHHFDDVIETTLMNMLNAGSFQTMLPKLKSTNHCGMELIRPMYLIKEHDINRWKKYNELEFIQCACKLTEQAHNSEDGIGESQRFFIKKLIKDLAQDNPQIEKNIFKAASNVNMNMILGYKMNGKEYSFLDFYDDIEIDN